MATEPTPRPHARRGETVAAPSEPSTGDTTANPQLPHERDESAKQSPGAPRRVIEQARKDVERGLVDTDRGPPADDAYRKQKR